MIKSFLAALLVALPLFSLAAQADVLRLAVSANFLHVAQTLAQGFETQTGHTVTISSGSTGTLYNQISHGAPFDVFLAADSRRPEMLAEAGKTVGQPVTYAFGRLVFWEPDAQKVTYQTLKAWPDRLAMANPNTAPYGLAAKQVLEHLNLWDSKKGQIVQGGSIQQAWQFVATGNAKGGFVALSQLRADGVDSRSYLLIRDELYTPIRQQAVVLASSKQITLGRQFLNYVLSAQQQTMIQKAGYFPVSVRPESTLPEATHSVVVADEH